MNLWCPDVEEPKLGSKKESWGTDKEAWKVLLETSLVPAHEEQLCCARCEGESRWKGSRSGFFQVIPFCLMLLGFAGQAHHLLSRGNVFYAG